VRTPFIVSAFVACVAAAAISAFTLSRRIDRLEGRLASLQEHAEQDRDVRVAVERLIAASSANHVGAFVPRPPSPATVAVVPAPPMVEPPPSAGADAVDSFLATSRITPDKWRALQDANNAETEALFRLSRELSDDTPKAIAEQKAADLQRGYADRRRALLSSGQLDAYERFRNASEVVSQVAFAGGDVILVRHRY
jgi:hypothetical protein